MFLWPCDDLCCFFSRVYLVKEFHIPGAFGNVFCSIKMLEANRENEWQVFPFNGYFVDSFRIFLSALFHFRLWNLIFFSLWGLFFSILRLQSNWVRNCIVILVFCWTNLPASLNNRRYFIMYPFSRCQKLQNHWGCSELIRVSSTVPPGNKETNAAKKWTMACTAFWTQQLI